MRKRPNISKSTRKFRHIRTTDSVVPRFLTLQAESGILVHRGRRRRSLRIDWCDKCPCSCSVAPAEYPESSRHTESQSVFSIFLAMQAESEALAHAVRLSTSECAQSRLRCPVAAREIDLRPENRHASPYGFALWTELFPDISRCSPNLAVSCIQADAGDHSASIDVTETSVAAL